MSDIIYNSRGDTGVVRSQVIGYTVDQCFVAEPGYLWVLTAVPGGGQPNQVPFEVANNDEIMKSLVERFEKELNRALKSPLRAEDFAAVICEAVGLDPNMIQQLEVVCETGEIARLSVKGLVMADGESLADLKAVLKHYWLKPIEGGEGSVE